MLLRDKLIAISDKMHTMIKKQIGMCELHTEDFGWENYRYYSPLFRLAHVERYFQDNLLVLHVTCFPHANDASPIFGFDVIGSEKTNTVSGIFLDWSPTISFHRWNLNKSISNNRDLPGWADIFSAQMIAVRPETEEETDSILNYAVISLREYIGTINNTITGRLTTEGNIKSIIERQNRYCERQAQNPRTLGALTHKIGKNRAEYFMQNVLFPQIKTF